MLGCYRKGEANDPKIYAATIAAILARYSKEVVDAVTDPVGGLPVQTDFMPTPKEVKTACEAEALRLDRIQQYRALPPPVPRIENAARGREVANLFVPDDVMGFAALFARHTEAGADSPCEVQPNRVCADGKVRRGLLVPMAWQARAMPRTPTSQPNEIIDDFIPFDAPPIEHPEEAAA